MWEGADCVGAAFFASLQQIMAEEYQMLSTCQITTICFDDRRAGVSAYCSEYGTGREEKANSTGTVGMEGHGAGWTEPLRGCT